MKREYNRILLKLSGEALAGKKGFGVDSDTLKSTCNQIKKFVDKGIETALVIGGGNYWRGRTSAGMDRSNSDYIGMLATIMNSLVISDVLESMGVDSRVMSAFSIDKVAELFEKKKAINHLKKKRVLIFAAGLGNPYFSTDTAAALRAVEIEADIIFLAKNVDGVYSADPKKDSKAVKYDRLSYNELINKNLTVMDQTAVTLCKENNMPILVFGLNPAENIEKALNGELIGTIVEGD